MKTAMHKLAGRIPHPDNNLLLTIAINDEICENQADALGTY